ncbi:AMP-binding protein [Nocardia aurantia]|uniref:AMP-binding protein n=1 Tax=Nocardia aurantia TaxID=2585199 RepID=UPI001294B964
MATDVIDVTVELPVTRNTVWELLTDAQTYSRIFTGIGACDRLETIGGNPLWQVRIGTGDVGISTFSANLVVGLPGQFFELHHPVTGSLAAVRLRDGESAPDGRRPGTRITVTLFAAGRVHPVAAAASNADIADWAVAGLRRLSDVVLGAPTAVIVNGEDTPLRQRAEVARRMVSTGVLRVSGPIRSGRQLSGLARWGFNLAGGYAAGAGLTPDRTAIIDDHGQRSFGDVDDRSTALAGALADLGLGFGDAIGLLSRNHAGMVETMVAAGKLGVDVILLNAGLAARRIEDIVQQHRLRHLFVDGELDELVRYLHADIARFSTDGRSPVPGRITLDELIAGGRGDFRRPVRPGRLVVLTSGTSGSPKGARRPEPKGFATVAALMSRIPFRMNETMLIPAPLFHTWGLAALQLSTPLRATVVLPGQFDAEDTLRLVAEHEITTLVLVPTMVQRILDLPISVRARYDTSSLRIAASCGAPLSGAAVLRFMDTYGDILYNVYGSTEVSWATVATPSDLRTAPLTAGRPPLGTRIAVLDSARATLPIGATGRIYVGNHMLFDGYVNSTPPEEADGMLDTGDLGYIDADGRLYIAGRDDEMIISGGENVFPRPVEEALSYLPQVTDVAVVGVPDREFGQRLAAFVVKRDGFGLDPDMIRTYVRHRLGRFSVPRDVTFLSSLPRGETGKVLKRLLVGVPSTDTVLNESAL